MLLGATASATASACAEQPGSDNGDVKGRLAVVLALALGVSTATAAGVPHGTSALRKFTYRGAGTNVVNIQTGELRELRSEERRVGKEGRSRWWAEPYRQ